MAKVTRRVANATHPITEMWKADAGLGVSNRISDRGFWLDDLDENVGWYEALQDLNANRDKEALVSLLKTSVPPPRICFAIADALERHDLVPVRKTGPRFPSYERSPAMMVLESALMEIKQRRRGTSVKEAIDKAARRRGIHPGTLEDAYRGKHGGYNRTKGRRPPKLTKAKKSKK